MMADKAYVTKLLKTARGQLDGILKMVEEDTYTTTLYFHRDFYNYFNSCNI